MQALVTTGAGFLLAVLWFDLMFDIQVLPYRAAALPDGVVESISSYYRRVTTEAAPMSRLVVLFMLVTVAGIVAQIVRADGAAVARWLSLALAVVPTGLAATRTVPRAVRLGSRRDPIDVQASAARSIFTEHVVCLCCISALLLVQLVWMQ